MPQTGEIFKSSERAGPSGTRPQGSPDPAPAAPKPPRPIDIAELRRLAASGLTRRAICIRLGCSYDRLQHAATRHGVAIVADLRAAKPPSPFWLLHDADLTQMRDNGWSFKAIAAALGVTKNAAIGRASRLGLIAPHITPAPPTFGFPPPGHCLWIDGDPRKPGARCCGKRTEPGRSYCPEHHRIVFLAPKPMREAA